MTTGKTIRDDRFEEKYRQKIQQNPDDVEAHLLLGIFLRTHRKNFTEAEKEFRKVIEIKPSAEAHCNLGLCLENLGRYAEAEEEFFKALEIYPLYTEAVNNLIRLRKKTHTAQKQE